MEALKMVPADLAKGAEAVRSLMADVGRIGNDSLPPEHEGDTRDYAAMTLRVLQALSACAASSDRYREGFARALADLLCLNADGAGVGPEEWDPVENTGGPKHILPADVVNATRPGPAVDSKADLTQGSASDADEQPHAAVLGVELEPAQTDIEQAIAVAMLLSTNTGLPKHVVSAAGAIESALQAALGKLEALAADARGAA